MYWMTHHACNSSQLPKSMKEGETKSHLKAEYTIAENVHVNSMPGQIKWSFCPMVNRALRRPCL